MRFINYLVILLLSQYSTHIYAKEDITYVGGGRYVCRGSDCSKFNRLQEARNGEAEYREKLKTEMRQESDAIVKVLKERELK